MTTTSLIPHIHIAVLIKGIEYAFDGHTAAYWSRGLHSLIDDPGPRMVDRGGDLLCGTSAVLPPHIDLSMRWGGNCEQPEHTSLLIQSSGFSSGVQKSRSILPCRDVKQYCGMQEKKVIECVCNSSKR